MLLRNEGRMTPYSSGLWPWSGHPIWMEPASETVTERETFSEVFIFLGFANNLFEAVPQKSLCVTVWQCQQGRILITF
jgi:hypothetical protein